MRVLFRIYLESWRAALLTAMIFSFVQSSLTAPQAPVSAEIPVVKGDAGPCTADFVVTDWTGKGVYNAKIEIQLKYGFMGLHKLDATSATNYDGKARFEGLPDEIKGTAVFKITQGEQSRTLPYDPVINCHSRQEITFEKK